MFSTKEFASYAKKNLVLMEVDFPARKAQPEALKKANQKLKEQYKVEGYPTLVLLGSDGKKLGAEVGYGGGGPKHVIAQLDKYRKKQFFQSEMSDGAAGQPRFFVG